MRHVLCPVLSKLWFICGPSCVICRMVRANKKQTRVDSIYLMPGDKQICSDPKFYHSLSHTNAQLMNNLKCFRFFFGFENWITFWVARRAPSKVFHSLVRVNYMKMSNFCILSGFIGYKLPCHWTFRHGKKEQNRNSYCTRVSFRISCAYFI